MEYFEEMASEIASLKLTVMVTLSFYGVTRKLSNTAGPCELL